MTLLAVIVVVVLVVALVLPAIGCWLIEWSEKDIDSWGDDE